MNSALLTRRGMPVHFWMKRGPTNHIAVEAAAHMRSIAPKLERSARFTQFQSFLPAASLIIGQVARRTACTIASRNRDSRLTAANAATSSSPRNRATINSGVRCRKTAIRSYNTIVRPRLTVVLMLRIPTAAIAGRGI